MRPESTPMYFDENLSTWLCGNLVYFKRGYNYHANSVKKVDAGVRCVARFAEGQIQQEFPSITTLCMTMRRHSSSKWRTTTWLMQCSSRLTLECLVTTVASMAATAAGRHEHAAAGVCSRGQARRKYILSCSTSGRWGTTVYKTYTVLSLATLLLCSMRLLAQLW